MTLPAQADASGGLRILVIEDCEADAELTLRILQAAGLKVTADIAWTAEDVFRRIRTTGYDVILSDYRLPSTTGMEIFRRLRSEGCEAPFLLLTGALGEETAVECLKQGVTDFVLKDRVARLPEAVKRALKEHRTRKEREQAFCRVAQLNRLYSVLSRVCQAVTRIHQRDALLREACRILNEDGGFKLAWVGLAEPGKGFLQPIASSPDGSVFVQELRLAPGEGAAGRAFQDCQRVVSNDLLSDVRMQPVWKGARLYGYRSVAAYPIVVRGRAIGACGIYADEAGFFDDENVRLLDELAAEICFAIERMESEEMRQRSVAELDRFFALSREMLCICDLDGRMYRLNAAWQATLGFSLEELQRFSWRELVHPGDHGRAGQALEELRNGREVENLELRYRTKDGRHAWLMGSATPDLTRGLLFVAARDITERIRLEEAVRHKNQKLQRQNRQVKEAARLKDEFVANMSHELRSPLNGIIGFTELIYDGKLGPVGARQRECIGRVHASAEHLLHLINGVLDLSKVEAGRMDVQPEWVVVPAVVNEVVGILGALASRKQIAVSLEMAPEVDRVWTDPAMLKQVLHNYVSNALKFTAEGGCIIIRVKAEGEERFRIEVADSGMGIAQSDMEQLFVPFRQLDATRAKRHPGTGLGLALTKRIVEAQGGSVGVSSSVGEGSTFHACLPRPRQAEKP